MSNHPSRQTAKPAGWKSRGYKLDGRQVRTGAKGERLGRAARGVKPGGGGIGIPRAPRLRRRRSG